MEVGTQFAEQLSSVRVNVEKVKETSNIGHVWQEVHRDILDILSHGYDDTSFSDHFQKIVDVVYSTNKFKLVWFGILDPRTRYIVPIARSGSPTEYVDNVKVCIDLGARNTGPAVRTVRHQLPTVVDDIADDLMMVPWRESALKAGLRSLATLPIYIDRGHRGILVCYSKERKFFTPEMVSNLQEVSYDISKVWRHLEILKNETTSLLRQLTNGALTGPDQLIVNSNPWDHLPISAILVDENFNIQWHSRHFAHTFNGGERLSENTPLLRIFPQKAQVELMLLVSKLKTNSQSKGSMIVDEDEDPSFLLSGEHLDIYLQTESQRDNVFIVVRPDHLANPNVIDPYLLDEVLKEAPVALLSLSNGSDVNFAFGSMVAEGGLIYESFVEMAERSKGDPTSNLQRIITQANQFDGAAIVDGHQIELHVRRDGENPRNSIAFAVDISNSITARRRVERQSKSHRAMIELGSRLAEVERIEQLREVVTRTVQELEGVADCKYLRLHEGGQMLLPVEEGESLANVTIKIKKSPRLNHALDHADALMLESSELALLDADRNGVTFAAIPLVGRHQVLGIFLAVVGEAKGIDASFKATLETITTLANANVTRIEVESSIYEAARIDRLTGLLNRDAYSEALGEALDQLPDANGGKGDALLVATLDIDRFKQINEALGHDSGDKVVAKLADVIRAACGFDAIVARVGGDEFAFFMRFHPTVTEESATVILETILRVVTRPLKVGRIKLLITASMGATLVRTTDERSTALILSKVDMAMYDAKGSQDRICFYRSKKEEPTTDSLELMSELTEAIDEAVIEVYLQPKMHITTRRICGFEALARWRSRVKGFIPPDKFILMAEQTGQIRALTDTVLFKSISYIAKLQEKGYFLPIAVNLSPALFTDDTIVDTVTSLLQDAKVNDEYLEFEVTETASIVDKESARSVFERLQEHGFRVSIDDFGTGFSSLDHLRNTPASAIKIDKSFTDKVTSSTKELSIVKGVIELGHALNFSVVAEGVEDTSTLFALENLGCDEIQGYLLARPMKLEAVFTWLESHCYRMGDEIFLEDSQISDDTCIE
ncbi:MAG: EAL domain-containing protein [Actinomycetota bacterium]|nr:EAL domain-containing protein [Actinomycetota bacterium]